MKHLLTVLLIVTSVIVLAALPLNEPYQQTEVPYPEGYRMWTHIKTGLIGPSNPNFQFSGGFHHIYANTKAMQGYNSGYFPEGSILVFDVLDAKEQNGNTREDSRNHIDVMLKDSIKFISTGGWGYEEFKGDSHTERVPILKTQCFNCHARTTDFIFSEFRR